MTYKEKIEEMNRRHNEQLDYHVAQLEEVAFRMGYQAGRQGGGVDQALAGFRQAKDEAVAEAKKRLHEGVAP